jgi:hypothetical protein
MFVCFTAGSRRYRVRLDHVALVEEIDGGALVYLKLPARCVPGSDPLNSDTSVIELTGEEARDLLEAIDSII